MCDAWQFSRYPQANSDFSLKQEEIPAQSPVNATKGVLPLPVIRHAPRWAVYTTNFALFTFIIKHNSRRHNKTRWRTARPRTQNRNAAHGGDTQRAWHPQTRQSKTTANGPRRIASRHGESASAKAATHVSLRRPREDVGILLEGALRLAIR